MIYLVPHYMAIIIFLLILTLLLIRNIFPYRHNHTRLNNLDFLRFNSSSHPISIKLFECYNQPSNSIPCNSRNVIFIGLICKKSTNDFSKFSLTMKMNKWKVVEDNIACRQEDLWNDVDILRNQKWFCK